MNRLWFLKIATIGVIFILNAQSFGQLPQPSPEDSGYKPFVVTRGTLGDVLGRRDTIIADFNGESEADAYASRLNKRMFLLGYNYSVQRRDELESDGKTKPADDTFRDVDEIMKRSFDPRPLVHSPSAPWITKPVAPPIAKPPVTPAQLALDAKLAELKARAKSLKASERALEAEGARLAKRR